MQPWTNPVHCGDTVLAPRGFWRRQDGDRLSVGASVSVWCTCVLAVVIVAAAIGDLTAAAFSPLGGFGAVAAANWLVLRWRNYIRPRTSRG